MIWSKAFIMERERFDGADVAHLLLHCLESSTGSACWTASEATATGGCCSPTSSCSATSIRGRSSGSRRR